MLTNHSLERTQERAGYNARTSARLISNALERGKEADNFGLREREYLLTKTAHGRRAVIYNSFCFIFAADNYCITMHSLPKWFGKTLYDGKHKIRNARKYMRHNNVPCEMFA